MTTELDFWIRSKPGPFAGRTLEDVWAKAWINFSRDHPSSIDGELTFRMYLGSAGFRIRHLDIGRYTLDRFL